MIKKLVSLVCLASLAGASLPAFSQQVGSVRIDFLGPGGHSQSNYGRTSALHAAGRTAILIQQALPGGSYAVTNLTGGNSVNSIASDGLIELKLTAANAAALQSLIASVTSAAEAGALAENNFRGVRPGDLVAGAPAHIRYAVTDTSTGPRPNPLRAFAKPITANRSLGGALKPDHNHDDPNHACNW